MSIVALEWIVRQAVGSNLLFGWLEMSSVVGVMAAAFSVPSILISSGDSLRTWRPGLQASQWLPAYVAIALAVSFGVCALWGGAASGRSYYFPAFSLREPFLLIAGCMSVWAARSVWGALRRHPVAPGGAVSGSRATLPVMALLAASLLVVMGSAGPSESATALISQISWGLLSREHFLALIFGIVLFEAIRSTGRGEQGLESGRFGSSGSSSLFERSTTDAAGSGGSFLGAGLVLPVGVLVLLLALVLGVPPSEAVVCTTVPWLIIAAGSVMPAFARRSEAEHVAGGSRSGPRRFSMAPRTFANAITGVVTLSVATVVFLGYARAVEALAMAGCAFFVLAAAARPPGWDAARFISVTSARIGWLTVCALASGAVHVASQTLGTHEAAAGFALSRGMDLEYVVAFGLVVATVLARWLSPIGVALCLMPVLPAALDAAGSGVHQTLVLYASIVGAAFLAQGYLGGTQGPSGSLTLARLLYVLTAVLVFAALPELSTFTVDGRRFW